MKDTNGVDLMVALGMPKKSDSKGKPAGNSYWADKPAELKGYLMDAVDTSLSKDERAQALCMALESHLEHQAGEYDEEEEPAVEPEVTYED